MTDVIDEKIADLFKILTNKKTEVEAAELDSKKKWVTNCAFPPVFGSTLHPINIQTQKEDVLQDLLTDLLIRNDYAAQAAKILGNNDFKEGHWAGFPISAWIEDFKTRVAKIQLNAKKAQLGELEKRLDAIVSPEQRRKMEIEAIIKELGG